MALWQGTFLLTDDPRRLAELNRTNYNPVRGKPQPAACAKATTVFGGFWGPWLE